MWLQLISQENNDAFGYNFTQTSYDEGILFDNNDYKIKDLSVYVATKDSKDKNLKKQNFRFGDI